MSLIGGYSVERFQAAGLHWPLRAEMSEADL